LILYDGRLAGLPSRFWKGTGITTTNGDCMTQETDKIKAVLEDLSTSDLTCSAKLVAVIHALGIEEPKEIERLTGLKPAGARKARCQLKDHRSHSSATPVARHSSSATTVANRHSSSGPSRVGAPAHKEYPSGINISSSITPQTPQGGLNDHLNSDAYFSSGVVRQEDGSIQLVNGTRSHWLKMFQGDEVRLELALIQAAGEVQIRSRNPVKLQVERSLARIAGQKHDGDNRYKSAVKRNQQPADASSTFANIRSALNVG